MGSERVPVPLSPGESAKRSARLALVLVTIADTEEAKAESAAAYNEELKSLREEAHELAAAVHRGYDERLDVDEIRDLEGGDMVTVRKDTGEEIRRRPLAPDELQVTIEDLRERRERKEQEPLAVAVGADAGPPAAGTSTPPLGKAPAAHPRSDEPTEPVDVDPSEGPEPEVFEIE